MRGLLRLALLAMVSAPALAWGGMLSVSAGCQVNTGVDVVSCNPLSTGNYMPPVPVSNGVTAGIGIASYGVRADYGDVGIYLNARTLASAGEISTNASAQAASSYWDEIVVSSSTLAAGTPVLATIGLSIDGRSLAESTSIVGKVTSSSYAYLLANYALYAQGATGPLLQFSACSGTSPDFLHACDAIYDTATFTKEFTFQTEVGALLFVSGDITGAAYAAVGANEDAGAFPSNYGEVSSLNSSHTYLTADGVSFVGASGHDYTATSNAVVSVPEPSSVALLLLGLSTLLTHTSRRRRLRPSACSTSV